MAIFKNLLIIDDDKSSARSIYSALHERSFRIDFATSIKEGLQLLKTGVYDSIVFGMELYGQSDKIIWEQALKLKKPTCFVGIGNKKSQSEYTISQEAKFDVYLSKPIKLRSINSLLRVNSTKS